MRLWDWTVTGHARLVWVWTHRRPPRGQVQAVTKSEARAKIKAEIGIDSLPPEVVVY